MEIPEKLRAIDSQTLQLWYQIAGTGRRDLAWAPNARIGLEMTLLRMLAFSPSLPEHAEARPPSAQSAAARPMLSAPSAAVEVKTAPQMAAPHEDVSPKLNTSTIQPTAVDAPLLNKITDAQWHDLVEQMRVGAARSLASHCHVQMINDQIHLVYAPEFDVIASAKNKESLLNQLATVLDVRTVKFLMATPSERAEHQQRPPETHTPAERKDLNTLNLQQQRVESILQHPAVGVLLEVTSAVVVEGSLTAINDPEPN